MEEIREERSEAEKPQRFAIRNDAAPVVHPLLRKKMTIRILAAAPKTVPAIRLYAANPKSQTKRKNPAMIRGGGCHAEGD